MIQHRVYQCPKCFNTLLVSNKMLHDLRCTVENPATYENILRQSQQMSGDTSNFENSQNFSSRMSITNEDGTTTDIVREKNIRGKEELLEIKYDPQGNIISRKKADYYIPKSKNYNFHELGDYNDEEDNNVQTNYDNNNNTYYEMDNEVEVRKAPSVIYETAEAQEIVYEAPAKYDPHVTINKPIYEETVIKHDGGLSNDTLDNIIRNTMSQNSNADNSYNIQNNTNINGYDFSNFSKTNNNTNTNTYNQNYDMNNYNGQSHNGSNNLYGDNISTDNHNIYGDSTGMKSNNFNSYDYQY